MTELLGRLRPHVAKIMCAVVLSAALLVSAPGRADEPYARSRDYDLQNVKTHAGFDTDQREVRGEVTHSIAMLRDDVSQVKFDSVAPEDRGRDTGRQGREVLDNRRETNRRLGTRP